MLVHDLLERNAEHRPERQALWYRGSWISYGEIELRANRLGNALVEGGIRRGDRVLLLFENSPDYVAAWFAVLKAGAVIVPLAADTRGDVLRQLAQHADAKAAICSRRGFRQLAPIVRSIPALRLVLTDGAAESYDGLSADGGHTVLLPFSRIRDAGRDRRPDIRSIDIDLETIIYTSGSTGRPKGVMLTHLNTVANMRSIAAYFRLSEADRIMVILPFPYVFGKSLLLTHFLAGGSVVIDNGFMYPNRTLDIMAETEATGFAGVPSTYSILLRNSTVRERGFPHLRYIAQAGGAMAPALQKEVAEIFAPAKLFVMYGATEAAPRLSYLEPDDLPRKWGSIGKAIPNVELFVADENGTPLPPGQTGELVARGSNIMAGYWKDPDGTAAVLRHGLYFTGDLGVADEEGFLYVVGRKREIIKVRGFRISAKEIEEAILESPDVAEAAVVGVRDQIAGEAIRAYVVLRTGNDGSDGNLTAAPEAALRGFLAARLPPVKMPRDIRFLPELPKNDRGKIMKDVLSQEAE